MKNKKIRQDFIKPMRWLSFISIAVLFLCVITGLLSKDYASTGFYLLLAGFVIFIVLHIIQYKMMYRCRCRKCQSTEVFDMKRLIVTGVKHRCPKCNAKLKKNETI